MTDYTTDDARDALFALDPGVSHAEWVRIGMAARDAGLSVDDWIEWSSKADNFKSAKECHEKWRSFRDGGVGAGTLFYLAREAGWDRASPSDSGRSRPPARAPLPTRERKPRANHEPSPEVLAKRRQKMKDLLAIASPADASHPYLVRKDVSASGLLQVDASAIAGVLGYEPKTDDAPLTGRVLLAPLHDGTGEPRQVEMIDEHGRKIGLALSRAGLMWTDRPINPHAHAIGLCEGLATAKTLMQYRSHQVVSASTANNLPKIAKRLRELCPGAEIIVFADLGKDGQQYAEEAADSVMGIVVSPPADAFPAPNGMDFNDLAEVFATATFAEYLEARCVHPQRVTFAQASDRIPIDFVLPSLAAGTTGLLVGPGSVGKSFLSLELAMSVTLGRNIADIPGQFDQIRPGRTAMVFGEDDRAIINNRMHDLTREFRLTRADVAALDEDMMVLSLLGEDIRVTEVDMRSVREGPFVGRLRNICLGRRLVFVDPLIRLHDSDENDNTAASHLMLSIQRIARDTNCAIILLHHTGKGQQDGWAAARGASAITTTARWQMNLTAPTKEERESLSIADDDARLWVKCDGVKMNYGENLRHFWLRRGAGGVLRHAEPGLKDFARETEPFKRGSARSTGSPGSTRDPPGLRRD